MSGCISAKMINEIKTVRSEHSRRMNTSRVSSFDQLRIGSESILSTFDKQCKFHEGTSGLISAESDYGNLSEKCNLSRPRPTNQILIITNNVASYNY